MSKFRNATIALLGTGWLVAVILLYFAGHKPFTPDMALTLAGALGRLGVAAWLLSLGGALGHRIERGSSYPPLVRPAIQALLGLGLMGTGVLLVGSLAGISAPGFWLAGILLTIILWRDLPTWWGSWRAAAGLWRESDPFGRTLGIICLLLTGFALALALAPPIHFDALVYHLTMPAAYLQAGRVMPLDWIQYSGMPQVVEMLFTWAMALGGGSAAVCLGWLVGMIALAGLAGSLRHSLGARAAWVGIASLLSGFSLAASLAWGYADWPGLAFGWGCLAALIAWWENGRLRALVLGGVFAGLALSTKYTGGVVLLTGMLVLIWQNAARKRNPLPDLLRFGLPAVLISLPWWVRNFLASGNPFEPFFFNSGSDVGTRIYQSVGPWGNWQDIFLLPLRATYLGMEGGEGYGASIGPLLLGLGALFWLGWRCAGTRRKAALSVAALISGSGLLVWAAANQFSGFLLQTRLYFPVFAAFALLAAGGFEGLAAFNFSHLRLGRIIAALVLLTAALSLLELGAHVAGRGAVNVLIGLQEDSAYLENNLGGLWDSSQAVKALPESSQTLMLFEPRGYYCYPACLPDDHLDNWKQAARYYDDPTTIIAHWQAKGITHVLYNRVGGDFMRESGDPHYNPADWQALEALFAELPEPEAVFWDAYALYRLPVY